MKEAFEQFETEVVAEKRAAREKLDVDSCHMTLNQIGVQEKTPVCWSPNGEELCFVNGTHGITICKRGEGNQYVRSKLLIGHHHTVKSLLYHPSKNILVSCGLEGIFIWDLDTCTCSYHIDETTNKNGHEGQVECICWLYDGSILLTGGKDSTIKVWDVENSFAFIETIAAHKSSVEAISACSSQDYFVSAGRDSTINIWNSSSLRPEVINKRYDDKGIVCSLYASMDGHHGDVSTLTLSTDGLLIFSGARDNTIRAWDYKSHCCIREIKDHNNMSAHQGDITNLFCINNNQLLVSFSVDGTMHVSKLGSMQPETKMEDSLALTSLDDILRGFTETETEQVVANDELLCNVPLFKDDGVYCTAMNPTIPLIAVAACHNCVKIFDVQQNLMMPVLIQELVSHSDCINDITINDQGYIITASNDYTVNVFHPTLGTRIMSFNTGAAMYSVASNNDIIYAAGKDYVIHCYSMNRQRFYQAMEQQYALSRETPPPSCYDLFNLVGHSGKIRSIAFSPDLKQVYSGSEDGSVMIHSIPELEPQEATHNGRPKEDDPDIILDDHTGIVLGVTISDDVNGTHYLASVGNDYTMNVYTVGKRASLYWKQQQAHNSVLTAVTFGHGASANYIFTGGWDGFVKVWNCETKEMIRELNYHNERVTALSVSKDGQYLISASADKTILMYSIPNDFAVVAQYCSDDECKCVTMTKETIVAGYESGVVRLWPLPSEQKKQMFSKAQI